jgi:signal transduction histidine kinase
LPRHYDNPAFREDLLRTMSQSVENINNMCSRLRPLSKELELERVESDLNRLVTNTVKGLDNALKASLVQELGPALTIDVDPEQIQKVLTNLLLNANEATTDDGVIRVSTEDRNGWAVVSVSDDGCGMSRDFIARSLFKAFQSTKKRGLGIGLFHSKKVVEAHGGKLEVESEPGKGTTFRVVLPLSMPAGGEEIHD